MLPSPYLLVAALYISGTLAASVHRRDDISCAALVATLAGNSTFTVTNATYYPANVTFTTNGGGGSNTTALGSASYSALPAFCREYLHKLCDHLLMSFAGAELHLNTANKSNATAEVWMPDRSKWNGRFLAAGNGGLGGFSKSASICPNTKLTFDSEVNYEALIYSGLENSFAAVSTNGGHSNLIENWEENDVSHYLNRNDQRLSCTSLGRNH